MIKIKIVCIGKDKNNWVNEGSEHFLKMLSRYANVTIKTLPAYKVSASISTVEIKKRESEKIKNELDKGFIIALVDSGEKYDSLQFAKQLEKYILNSKGQIIFVIGGAYGLDESVLNRADLKLSLSPLTFSHQLVRVILLEQLFRAFSIIHNTDYHK